jgi:hypothetical protein
VNSYQLSVNDCHSVCGSGSRFLLITDNCLLITSMGLILVGIGAITAAFFAEHS